MLSTKRKTRQKQLSKKQQQKQQQGQQQRAALFSGSLGAGAAQDGSENRTGTSASAITITTDKSTTHTTGPAEEVAKWPAFVAFTNQKGSPVLRFTPPYIGLSLFSSVNQLMRVTQLTLPFGLVNPLPSSNEITTSW